MARRPRPARGAALLIAMVLVTVVATLAAGMVWQQWQAVQVEAAERSRVQARWILNGALDWARLILAEDARTPGPTTLNAPWATPLAEARLSTFLAAGQRDAATNAQATGAGDDAALDAFLSGSIRDASARWNLRQLIGPGFQPRPDQVQVLERLCAAVDLPASTATQIAAGLAAALNPASRDAPLAPRRIADLVWMGLDDKAVAALERVAVWLPDEGVPLNLNTADAEVLAAVLPGADAGSASRLVRARQTQPFQTPAQAAEAMGLTLDAWKGRDGQAVRVGVRSNWFEVTGRMRMDQRIVEERSLVRRDGRDVRVLHREVVAGRADARARPENVR